MPVAFPRRRIHAIAVHGARVVRAAHPLERLPAMEITRGIVGMGFDQRVKLAHGRVVIGRILVFHRQPIPRECVVGVLFQHALQGL